MITRRMATSGGVRPDGDRPATSAVSASRSRPAIGRSDDGVAPWGRWVILHLWATSRSLSGPADRAARTVVTQSSLSCRVDSRQPALPAPPCEPDRAVTLAHPSRGAVAGRGGDTRRDRIRAEIRAWAEPRPSGQAVARTTGPTQRRPQRRTEPNLAFGSASTCPAMIEASPRIRGRCGVRPPPPRSTCHQGPSPSHRRHR